MSEVKVTPIGAPLQLGEGPHWDEKQQALFYVDIAGHSIYRYKPDNQQITHAEVDASTTSFVIPIAGSTNRFIISRHRKIAEMEWDGVSSKPCKIVDIYDVDSSSKSDRINDAKCDPKGRLFCGTMGKQISEANFEPEAGTFMRIDSRQNAPKVVRDKVGISNGLAWAKDKFYYIDSLQHSVDQYDYDEATGEISNKKVVLSIPVSDGIPDGMCIDNQGKLWVAVFGGGKVLRVDPQTGTILQTVDIPALQTTSVCFGGKNMDILYVTSAAVHSQSGLPLAGNLFQITGLGVTGPLSVAANI